MIRTNHGILVKTRRVGNEMTMPLPKNLSIKKGRTYLITKDNNGNLVCKPQKKNKNIFDNPYYNRKNVKKFMKMCGLSMDQGRPVGKEW